MLRAHELDWRTRLENHQEFRPMGDGEFLDVRTAAVRIARRLRLGFSSQDWIVAEGGGPVFLEANPSGRLSMQRRRSLHCRGKPARC
jgi:hypothetical protein